MAGQNVDLFDAYFRRADLDRDGRISGNEAVTFFQGSNLAKPVLAQIWMHADQHKTGFLGRAEFYNALKLVTVAQSKRELTPDIVKAALFGPASAKIPAPQINASSAPDLPSNPTAGAAGPQLSGGALPPSHNMGVRAPQLSSNTNMGPQFFPLQQNHIGRPPLPPPASTAFRPQLVVGSRLPGMSATAASQALGTNISTDWLGGMTSGSPAGVTTQAPNRGITPLTTSAHPMPNANSGLVQPAAPKPNDSIFSPSHMGGKDSKPTAVSGNGFTSDSVFGDVFSVSSSQAKQDAPLSVSSSGNLLVTPATVPASAGLQSAVNSSSLGSLQSAFSQQPVGGQNQKILSTVKGNQQVPVQNSAEFNFSSAGFASGYPVSGQSQIPWPRMTQSDVQKYTKVFVEVDTDRDGRITGEQARNLFLSWRLPREILKQVWDLSDQDNDSMLSFREFCIALYLMEHNREGRPLPKTLPSSMFDETLFSSGQAAAAAYGKASWRPTPGLQQTRVMPGAPPVTLVARGRPPKPVAVPLADEHIHPTQQKSKVPVLEKRLINQLSEEEQSSLNLKFQDATEANKKVEDLEKDILDSREKTEFYRSKMQELILYKSRCDNRLNEIIERTSADKREAELLAKKYEEKYKQIGDVASKLPIEEATFHDIQDKKMELYRSIVKMGQDGKPENIQVSANQIQSELEELVKSLNERCKCYGLRAKPTTLVELPFGWQPGLQEGAADWDESWDKFEDEGFTFVKELTLDVQNVVAPQKPKSSSVVNKLSSTKEGVDVSSTNADRILETLPNGGERVHVDAHDEKGIAKSPPDSPAHAVDSPSHKSQNSPARKNFNADGSPHVTESEHGRAESELDKRSRGAFNTRYDSAFFDAGDLDLPPIRTDSSHQRNSPFPFADSVPSTPLFSSGNNNTALADNIYNNKTFVFDSVPSTPLGENLLFQKKTTFAFDSVPGTPQSDNLFQHKSVFAFDSVPSTPVYNYNNEENKFDSFNESGVFPAHGSLSRFDSMSSSTTKADLEYNTQGFFPHQQDSFARFDSFRSTADSEINNTPQGFFQTKDYARFDSISSNRDYADDTHGFDDADRFGSSGTFKTSVESQTPRRGGSDNWRAF